MRLLALSALTQMFYLDNSARFVMEKLGSDILCFFSKQLRYLAERDSNSLPELLRESIMLICCLNNFNDDKAYISERTLNHGMITVTMRLVEQICSYVAKDQSQKPLLRMLLERWMQTLSSYAA